MSDKWRRCRDVAAGQDAIRAGAERYLNKLTDQTPESYQAYLYRAAFFNATWRTICGMCGMMFRKPEIVEVPNAITPFLDDITMSGEPLHIFAQQLAQECFTVGRVGVMVDHPVLPDETTLTIAQAQSLGMRPNMKRYTAESIINWRTGSVNNITKLMQVVLTEQFYIAKDEFSGSTDTQYRVLDLVPSATAPMTRFSYRVRLFRIDPTTGSQYQVGNDAYPLMNGKPLDTIPFVFLGVDSITPNVQLPPLIDLVDLNLAHFKVSADYEHGCHFTGLPTPCISGYVPRSEGEKLYIGSTSAWIFNDPSTKAYFLEFSGNGLAVLENNLDRKEAQMAAIGARLLAADKRLNETATTAAIHHGGETSILSAVAQAMSKGVTTALTTFSQWAGATGNVSYDINRDFFPVPMDAPTLTALVGAWQAGAISQETLFDNLQEGEVISSDSTFEKESAKIQNDPPAATKAPAAVKPDPGVAPPSATAGTTVA